MSEKRYKVHITMSGGDEVRAVVLARNCNDAKRRLYENETCRNFINSHGNEIIASVEVEQIKYKPGDNHLTITNAPNKPQWYYVDHFEAGIRLEFKKHHYNEMQNVWTLEGFRMADPLECATALREIGEWVAEYFPEMV